MAEEVTNQSSEDETPVVCEHCGYSWDYSGSLQKVTCPSCQRKTDADTEEEDNED